QQVHRTERVAEEPLDERVATRVGGSRGRHVPTLFLSSGEVNLRPLPSSPLGEIAQLVEHTTENRGVPGSSPGLAIHERPAKPLFQPQALPDVRSSQILPSAFSCLF